MPEDGSVALAVESGDVAPVDGKLTDDHRDAFWKAFQVHYTALMDAARAAHVPVEDALDVVHSVAVRVLDSYDGRAHEFPDTESSLGRVLTAAVKKYAIDYHGRKREKLLLHRHWGDPVVPKPGGRRSPDRVLETVFAVLTPEIEDDAADTYDAGATAQREMLALKMPEVMATLTPRQVDTFDMREMVGKRRRISSKALRIKAKNFDYHQQTANAKARKALFAMIESGDIPEESRLRDTIEELEVRRLARNRHKAEARARGRAAQKEQNEQNGQKELDASDATERPPNGKKRRVRRKKRGSKKRQKPSDNGGKPTRRKKKGP